MFGGIIKNTGVIKHIQKNKKSMIVGIKSNISVNNKMIGS